MRIWGTISRSRFARKLLALAIAHRRGGSVVAPDEGDASGGVVDERTQGMGEGDADANRGTPLGISETFYGPTSACPTIPPIFDVRATLRVTATSNRSGVGELVTTIVGIDEDRLTFGYTTAGTALMRSKICGPAATSTIAYTATPTEFIAFQDDPDCGREVFLYRKP
jgi:hypothetical protein